MDDTVRPSVLKKNWGYVRTVHFGPHAQIDFLEIEAGGFSSKHCHQTKFNEFFLVSGRMLIHFYKSRSDATSRTQLLLPGSKLIVPPNIWHRFEAPERCVLIETYWSETLNPEDIVRVDQGGIGTLPVAR